MATVVALHARPTRHRANIQLSIVETYRQVTRDLCISFEVLCPVQLLMSSPSGALSWVWQTGWIVWCFTSMKRGILGRTLWVRMEGEGS